MIRRRFFCFVIAWVGFTSIGLGQDHGKTFGPYLYEPKPEGEQFAAFNPRLAPEPGELLLQRGDRLAICGDSITEQKMYSRMIETYLTVCEPDLEIAVRQFGWSGEKTDGFLRRMEQDCLTFEPTVATLAYGMNDSRYRPFDVNNGRWYEDHDTAIVRKFKDKDVRVVVGSPGCTGKIASWVNSREGTLREHNLNLCALRDIALGLAEREQVRFADIFWPMYQAQDLAPALHGATEDHPYEVAGRDGVHPGWAGHTLMAYTFLRSLGLKGDPGTIEVDLANQQASGKGGHEVEGMVDGELTIISSRYPFCADGDLHSDGSIRSGMTLVPFSDKLNRLTLKLVKPVPGEYRVSWGEESLQFSAERLAEGINLANEFHKNPFGPAFRRVDEVVAKKQTYETVQIKQRFHSKQAKQDFATVVQQTEAARQPLVETIAEAFQPVQHRLKIEHVSQ